MYPFSQVAGFSVSVVDPCPLAQRNVPPRLGCARAGPPRIPAPSATAAPAAEVLRKLRRVSPPAGLISLVIRVSLFSGRVRHGLFASHAASFPTFGGIGPESARQIKPALCLIPTHLRDGIIDAPAVSVSIT